MQGANNRIRKSATTSGLSASKERYWVAGHVREDTKGFFEEVMLELASEG